MTVLEKAGIYQLIFSSKLPSAEAFQDWVFEEVLPSIQETGSYSIQGSIQGKENVENLLDRVEPDWEFLRQYKTLFGAGLSTDHLVSDFINSNKETKHTAAAAPKPKPKPLSEEEKWEQERDRIYEKLCYLSGRTSGSGGWLSARIVQRGTWTWRGKKSAARQIRCCFTRLASEGLGKIQGTGDRLYWHP